MKSKIKGIMIFIIICLLLGIGGYYFVHKQNDSVDRTEKELAETTAAFEELMKRNVSEAKNCKWILVVNPSHGGMDAGNTSDLAVEKDVVLAVAKKIKEYNTNNNLGVFLVRESDINPDLSMRNEMIHALSPDLLIDLQALKDSTSQTFGTQVFYQTKFYDDTLTNVTFADMIEKSTVTKIKGMALGITEDVNEEQEILKAKDFPAIAIGLGYVSNPTEGELLGRDAYEDNLAKGILDGVYEAILTLEEKE